ncbi:MAG: hypothetical protein ACOC1X_03040 [Promethearchaeota archaeon]
MSKSEDKKISEYYKALQTLFRTDRVELKADVNPLYIFEISEEYLIVIEDMGDDNWSIINTIKKEK